MDNVLEQRAVRKDDIKFAYEKESRSLEAGRSDAQDSNDVFLQNQKPVPCATKWATGEQRSKSESLPLIG